MSNKAVKNLLGLIKNIQKDSNRIKKIENPSILDLLKAQKKTEEYQNTIKSIDLEYPEYKFGNFDLTPPPIMSWPKDNLITDILHAVENKDINDQSKLTNAFVEAHEIIQNKKDLLQNNGNIENPEIHLDYSDNTLAERIVFLSELGILDYLQIKLNEKLHGCSINKLAEVVSTFTGVPRGTAQSYLNPMLSKGVDQDKNPATLKNIEKVKNKLKNIGI